MNSILGGLCCANTRSKASTRIPLKDTAEGHAASVNAPVDGSTTEEPEKKSPFSMKTDTVCGWWNVASCIAPIT